MASRYDQIKENQIDDVWEMNMHINPLDKETEETLNRHKELLMGNSDDFIAYIKHVENSRK